MEMVKWFLRKFAVSKINAAHSDTYQAVQIYVVLVQWYAEMQRCKAMVAIVPLLYNQGNLEKKPVITDLLLSLNLMRVCQQSINLITSFH